MLWLARVVSVQTHGVTVAVEDPNGPAVTLACRATTGNYSAGDLVVVGDLEPYGFGSVVLGTLM